MSLSYSGLTTCRRCHASQVQMAMSGSQTWGPWCSDHGLHKMALWTWNVISAVGKDSERVDEVERYKLDIVRLTSWVPEPISLRGTCATLELSTMWSARLMSTYGAPVDERVSLLRLWVGRHVLTSGCAYMLNSSSEYSASMKGTSSLIWTRVVTCWTWAQITVFLSQTPCP